MQGILFFDESDTNSTSYVREQQGSWAAGGPNEAHQNSTVNGHAGVTEKDVDEFSGSIPDARYDYKSLACSGSLAVPELDATLTWWLDDGITSSGSARPDRVHVHLLVVNNKSSGLRSRSAQSRKMTVKLPVRQAADLLTCGVTKLVRGGNCVSVAWMTTALEVGYVRVVLQREADACGTLLLTPEGEMVHSQPIRSIASAVAATPSSGRSGGSALLALTGTSSSTDSATSGVGRSTSQSAARCGAGTTACVLAEIPTVDAGDAWEKYDYLNEEFYRRPNPATQPVGAGGSNTAVVAAMFVVTNGSHVWRVKLLENGLTSHTTLKDSRRKEQVGLLCSQLSKAAVEHDYHPTHTSLRHPLFSELSNLQRLTQRNGTAAAGEGDAEEELTPAGVRENEAAAFATRASPPSAASTTAGPKGWLTRFLGGGGKDGSGGAAGLVSTPKRRFLCVSAVQNSAYVALLRRNGLVEFYDSDLTTVEHFPTCYVPPQEVAPFAGLFEAAAPQRDAGGTAAVPPLVQQWSSLSMATNTIHYFASLGTVEGRRCVWARVPAVERTSDEKVVLRCAYGIAPPASGSAPMACAVNSREELAVLWDVGVEEDAHLLTARSISSLFNPSLTPVSAALQIVKGARGAEETWVWRATETYLCHASASLRVVLSEASDFILLEKALGMHKAYVLQATQRSLHDSGVVASLVETVRVDLSDEPDNEDGVIPFSSYRNSDDGAGGGPHETSVLQCVVTDSAGVGGGSSNALRAVRFVPTSTATDAPVAKGEREAAAVHYFTRGCDTLQSCVHGAALLAELLRDALTASFTGQQLMPALSRIMHEAHLAGYLPLTDDGNDEDDGADPSDAHRECIMAALSEAARVHSAPRTHRAAEQHMSTSPFCSFGRHYILHAVLRSLLNRVAFLAVTLIGVSSSRGPIAVTSEAGHHVGSSLALHGLPISKDGGAAALLQAMQLVVAAYHAAQIAGPELARFAPAPQHGEAAAYVTGDEMVSGILSRFLCRFDRDGARAAPPLSLFAIQVANGLYRCRTARTVRASAAWAAQLHHHFPILTHFRLLVDIDAGRTTHSTQQQDMCMKVVRSIASLGESIPSDASDGGPEEEEEEEQRVGDRLRALPAQCLLEEGFLVADAPCTSALAQLLRPDSGGFEEVRAWATQRPSLAPKLYAVGILRRLVPTLNSSISVGAPWLTAPPSLLPYHAKPTAPQTAPPPLQPQPQPPRRAAVSAAAVRHYYLTELSQVRASVAAMHCKAREDGVRAWGTLKMALNELMLDTLLYLAQCAVSEFDFGSCWHDLEEALELAGEEDVLHLYGDAFHSIVAKTVECACAGQANLDHLIATSSTTYAAVCLEELLVVKWYNFIARLPTKSASDATEALRYRAIMGLHRYLMSRHAYAQCGRVMSDLASLLRCSPQRRTGGPSTLSVTELAALAVSAVELIAPTAPVESGAAEAHTTAALYGSPLSSGFAWRHPQAPPQDGGGDNGISDESTAASTAAARARVLARQPSLLALGGSSGAGSPLSAALSFPLPDAGAGVAAGGLAATRLLSRDDLPWLRRRAYQARCERLLWHRGSTLDCTDLWIDGAPHEDFRVSAAKLTEALENAELWTEAYRFATLAEMDAVAVLEHWAIHLTRRTRSLRGSLSAVGGEHALDNEEEDIFDGWQSVIGFCAEQSSLENQFAGFRRVLLEVLTTDYENTAPELRDEHRHTDPYTAAATLLQVFTIMRSKLTSSGLTSPQSGNGADAASVDREEEEEQDGESAEDGAMRAELADRREALSWLPWAHAAQICTEVLTAAAARGEGSGAASARRPEELDVFTAGVVDPLARYAKLLPRTSQAAKSIVVQRHGLELDTVASDLMRSISSV